MRFGLLGYPLSHSYSPKIHKSFGSWPYELFPVERNDLETFFQNANFTGINVTSPYKKIAMSYCHHLSDSAVKAGCVNTIVRDKNGKLIGYNTDYSGFQYMVKACSIDVRNKKVLILGSGGAAGTVQTVLKELGANTVVISRSGENNYQNLHRHHDAFAIVNATPVGMFPNTMESLVDLHQFPDLVAVLDLIYNPARTKLIMDAEARGLRTTSGLGMLVAQAKESAQYFLQKPISDEKIQEVQMQLEKQTQNIILIGMPGCGKSTIGKCLAECLGRRFIDLDTEIQKELGVEIEAFIRNAGETAFRQIESDIIARYGKMNSLVVATGGGCVTKEENYQYLHQNGCIYWIKRDLDMLPTDGRPLSQKIGLSKLYEAREPLYERFSDHIVHNMDSIQSVVAEIMELEVSL